jgi:hypothetical protein
MGEPPLPKPARRPNLRDAIESAEAAGKVVRSATLEGGRLTLLFDNGTNVTGTDDDWARRIEEMSHAKDKRV